MKNLNQTIHNLLKNKYEIELTGYNSGLITSREPLSLWNSTLNNQITLGIRIDKHKWAWFKCYDEITTNELYFFFDHVYNMNTGKKIKAHRTGYKLRRKLNLID